MSYVFWRSSLRILFNAEFQADPTNQLDLVYKGKPICHSSHQPRQLNLIRNEQLGLQKLMEGTLSWGEKTCSSSLPRGHVMLISHELCGTESVLCLQAFFAEWRVIPWPPTASTVDQSKRRGSLKPGSLWLTKKQICLNWGRRRRVLLLCDIVTFFLYLEI